MSNEPERDIEKQLREIARQRREQSGAPLEMHPATRKLLQGEVARAHFARGLGSTQPRRFWTPRMQWIAGLAAACVVALAVVWPSMFKSSPTNSSRMELAKNTDAPQLTRDKSDSLAPAPGSKSEKEMELANAPTAATAAPAPAPLAQEAAPSVATKSTVVSDDVRDSTVNSPAQSLALQAETKAKDATTNPLSFAAAAPAARRTAGESNPAPPPPASVVASEPQVEVPLDAGKAAVIAGGRGGDFKAARAVAPAVPPAGAAFAVQQFALDEPAPGTLEALKKPASAAANVLTNFRVEQSGAQLQVIDSDGSVYAGTIATPALLAADTTAARDRSSTESFDAISDQSALKSVPANRAAAPTRGALDKATLADSYAVNAPTNTVNFRLRGTNLTLHQLVEFTGDLVTTNAIVLTNAATNANFISGKITNQALGSVSNVVGAAGGQSNPISQSPPLQLQLRNSILRGRAVIGGTNQLEINAHPATQP